MQNEKRTTMRDTMKHVSIRVFGQVQGVWFRKHTHEKAMQLGLVGFVQNQSDGSVLIHAQGEDPKIQEFIDWCDHGPPMANVEEVLLQEEDLLDCSCFEIRES